MHLCQPNEFSGSPRAGSKLGFVPHPDKNYTAKVTYSKCQPKAMILHQQKIIQIDLTVFRLIINRYILDESSTGLDNFVSPTSSFINISPQRVTLPSGFQSFRVKPYSIRKNSFLFTLVFLITTPNAIPFVVGPFQLKIVNFPRRSLRWHSEASGKILTRP